MIFSQKPIFLAAFLNLTTIAASVAAQVPGKPDQPAADTLAIARPDSLAPDSSALASPDTLARLDSTKTKAPSLFESPAVAFRVAPARRAEFLFQDLSQLGDLTLPVIPIISGEVGQPRYYAGAELPARAISYFIDGIEWIPGVYGTVDLMSLPEAGFERLEFGQPQASRAFPTGMASQVRFETDTVRYEVPFTNVEYANGPFDADAVRVSFGRAFSPRLTGLLNATLSNTNGQFQGLPYEGHKATARFDYRLNAIWRVRYRYFNSNNEAGLIIPFFPEEWPTLSGGFHKEVRLYHAVELAHRGNLTARVYNWLIKEELNDRSRKIKHQLRETGAEAVAGWQRKQFALTIQARLAGEKLSSATIHHRARMHQQVSANLGVRLSRRWWLYSSGYFRNKPDWPSGYAATLGGLIKLSQTSWIWSSVGRWKIPPSPAERDHSLEVFSGEDRLRAVTLDYAQLGIRLDGKNAEIQLSLGAAQWRDGYVLTDSTDTGGQGLVNSVTRENTFGLKVSMRFQPIANVFAGVQGAHALSGLPGQFWFWHQSGAHWRVYLEARRRLFDNTLEVLPRLSGRYLGERYSPFFEAGRDFPTFKTLASAATLDFHLRLQYGNGAFFLSWENILNREFNWRVSVPDPGLVFRWGFWWKFLN